jgi:hypothetical protein
VFSLGVLLHVLVTGDRPTELVRWPDEPRPPDVEHVLALADRLRHPEPRTRPRAAEVRAECEALASRLGGPSLRQWAAEHVPRNTAFAAADDLVGTTLTETVDQGTRFVLPASGAAVRRAPPWLRLVPVLALAVGTLGLVVVFVAFVVVMATLAPIAPPPEPTAAAPDPTPPTPAPLPEVAAVAPPPPEPAVAPPPQPQPRARAVAPPPPVPEAAPTPPSPEPTPRPGPVALAVVSFESDPPGAVVLLDGVAIGRTPLRGHPVSHGSYELRLEHGDRAISRTIRISARGSTHFGWVGDELVAR